MSAELYIENINLGLFIDTIPLNGIPNLFPFLYIVNKPGPDISIYTVITSPTEQPDEKLLILVFLYNVPLLR